MSISQSYFSVRLLNQIVFLSPEISHIEWPGYPRMRFVSLLHFEDWGRLVS